MKNKIKVALLSIIAIFTFLLASCGSSDKNMSYDPGPSIGEENNVVIQTTRKIYYTAFYDIECEDFTEIKSQINDKVNSLSGYVQKSSDGDNGALYIYRVPTTRLNEFLDYVDNYGDTVTSKKVDSTDITTSYSEIEAKKEVLTASRVAYLDLLNKGGLSMSDIIAIQDKISVLDIEIATIERELASYDNLLDYSTITIDYYKKTKDLSFFEQYGNYLAGFFDGLGKFILYSLPFVLCVGVLCLCVLGGVKINKIYMDKKNNKAKDLNNINLEDKEENKQ